MTDELLKVLETDFLPRVSWCGFKILEHEESGSFGNATVVLQQNVLRLRIVRERSQLFVDFGSVVEPGTWFDSAVVVDYLGLSQDAGFHGRDVRTVLDGLASLLKSCWAELIQHFDPANFSSTKKELTLLRDARAAKRLGY